LNDLIESIHFQIIKSTHLIITLGTSWVYRNTETNEIVANCHKIPQKQFTKELLSVEVVKESLQSIIGLIASVNPNAKFIFTVSPVRHIKDGFVENNASKALLISAVYQIVNRQRSKVNYFPSYEIMLDELRDYRFYAEDMLHPNQIAIDYIWMKFLETYIKEEEFNMMQQVGDVQKALQHRPFNPNSESHQQFLEKVKGKIAQIQIKLPHIRF